MKTRTNNAVANRLAAIMNTMNHTLARAAAAVTIAVAAAGSALGGYHALLIGVGEYENEELVPLEFATSDVDRLAKALTDRGEYRRENVWRCSDTAGDDRKPTGENLRKAVEDFLKGLSAGDTALVYFSGHGCQDSDGRLYLAPKDYDPNSQATTGLPADWVREQLAACKAGTKVLVLDSCYAGSKSGFASAEQLQKVFNNEGGVVTLASSSGAEMSIVDPSVGQSLFSYWFTKALTGHADLNMDAQLSFSEVYNYVRESVERDARSRHGKSQTPRQHVGFDVDGVPTVSALTPQPINVVLDDMADQIAMLARTERFELVGSLPEFSTRAWDAGRLRDVLKDDYGTLGRRLADDLRDRIDLRFASTGVRSQQVEPRLVLKALRDQKLTPDQITKSVAPFGPELSGKDCVILNGQIRYRQGDTLMLQTTIIQDGRDAHTVGGRALLTLNDWAETGRSVALQPNDFRRVDYNESGELKSEDASAIDSVEDRLASPAPQHPLASSSFPYRVKVLARSPGSRQFVERRPVFRKGKAYIGLDIGENYVIDVDYGGQQRVARGENIYAKILVDGVSILGTRLYDYARGPAGTAAGVANNGRGGNTGILGPETGDRPIFKGVDLIRVARPNAVSTAQEWVSPKGRAVQRYEGFYPAGGGDVARFEVVDAAESIGASRSYGQSVGMISVVFYNEVGAPRGGSVGTKPGEVLQGRTVNRIAREGYPGRQLAVIHLNYVSRAALAQMR